MFDKQFFRAIIMLPRIYHHYKNRGILSFYYSLISNVMISILEMFNSVKFCMFKSLNA